MRLRLLAILVLTLAAAPAARAQDTTGITLQVAASNTPFFNQAQCLTPDFSIGVTYDMPAGFTEGWKIKIFGTDKSTCPSAPEIDALVYVKEQFVNSSNSSGSFRVLVNELVSDCPANVEDDFLICAVVTGPDLTTGTGTNFTTLSTNSLTLTYDSQAPSTPQLSTPNAGDGSLYLYWSAIEGVDHFDLLYRKTPGAPEPTGEDDICAVGTQQSAQQTDPGDTGPNPDAGSPDVGRPDSGAAAPLFDRTGWEKTEVSNGDATSGTVRDLVNNQSYQLVVIAVDAAGNESQASRIVEATPLAVQDFYRRYRCAGGTEKGGFGCSTAGAIALPAAGLAVLALMRRRRKE